MLVRFSRCAVRNIARQHALLKHAAVPATRCDCGRRSAHIPARHPVPASIVSWRTAPLLSCRRQVAQGQHSPGQRCYTQASDGPRSLQSLADERRQQAEGEPCNTVHRDQRQWQSGVWPDDEVPTERRRSASQRSWSPKPAQTARLRMSAAAEADGDEAELAAQPRHRAKWRKRSPPPAPPCRRRVEGTLTEPAPADADEATVEATVEPDSLASQCAPAHMRLCHILTLRAASAALLLISASIGRAVSMSCHPRCGKCIW